MVNIDVIPFYSNSITVQKGFGDKTRKVMQKNAKKCVFSGPAYLAAKDQGMSIVTAL